MPTERLYRHPTDRVIGGVAAGLAAWMHVDPSLVRIAWVFLAIFSGGILVLVYFAMLLVVPIAPPGWTPSTPSAGGSGWGAPGPGGGTSGWQAAAPGGAPGAQGPGPATDGPPAPGWQGPAAEPPRVDSGNVGIVAGIVLVGLGIWFLIDQVVHIDWALLWPLFLVIAGVGIIATAMGRRGR